MLRTGTAYCISVSLQLKTTIQLLEKSMNTYNTESDLSSLFSPILFMKLMKAS